MIPHQREFCSPLGTLVLLLKKLQLRYGSSQDGITWLSEGRKPNMSSGLPLGTLHVTQSASHQGITIMPMWPPPLEGQIIISMLAAGMKAQIAAG